MHGTDAKSESSNECSIPRLIDKRHLKAELVIPSTYQEMPQPVVALADLYVWCGHGDAGLGPCLITAVADCPHISASCLLQLQSSRCRQYS